MPEWPASGSVFANTMYSPATPAFVMKRLTPLRTYASPSQPRFGAHRRRVRARARLGQRVGREPLAAREPGQETLLLLVRPGQLDAQRTELLDGHDQARRRADLGELLDRDERPSARRSPCRRTAPRRAGRRGRARGRARPCPTGTRPSCRSRPRAGRRARGRACGRDRGSRAVRRSTGRRPRRRVYLWPSSSRTRSRDSRISSAPFPITRSSYASASSAARSRRLTSRLTISSYASGSSSTIVKHRLYVVAVGVDHECRVVALVVFPLAGRPVVAIPGGQRDPVEFLDLRPGSAPRTRRGRSRSAADRPRRSRGRPSRPRAAPRPTTAPRTRAARARSRRTPSRRGSPRRAA